jgi:ABC-type antimicrobial peptide transport system permease subunit
LRIGGYHLTLTAGRNLDRRDAGTDHIVVPDDFSKPLGVRVGSHLVFREGSRRVPFTVVGIDNLNNPNSFTVFAHNEADLSYMQRMGLTSPSPSHFSTFYLKIRDSALQADIAAMRRTLPGVLILDLSAFLPIFNKVIDKLVVFPEVIAALSLFAGAVIIANTVSLAMLERRREIGVMKAVGARRRTVLQFLLAENAIVGFLGALAGVGLALAATVIVDQAYLHIGPSVDWSTVGGLILLGIALTVGASALTALPASGEKPMNVLRYE